jgi:predicted ribosomally synthesized peptide with SipW-like signal peptide
MNQLYEIKKAMGVTIMTKSKLTKKALLCSILTILLSTTMLIGTTFAWFTDTASTSVNKIQAGNLDVDIVDTNGDTLEGKTLNFEKSADAPANEEILWEPGCTYELQPIRITNNGNLALKYKISISGILGDAKLNDAITWTINDQEINLTEEHLSKGASSDPITIKGHMKEDAGNEYQGLSIDGIAITVYATQDTVEYDSNNNTYDANAPVIEATPSTIQNILDNVEGYTIIKLTAGDYGTLYFRQSEKSELYDSKATGLVSTGSNYVNGSNVTYSYHPGRTDVTYMRTLENITIQGCEGATVDNIVFLDGNYEYVEDTDSTISGNTIYSVKNTVTNHGTDTDWENKLISFFTIKNLTFKNIKFTGKSTVLKIGYHSNDAGLDTWTYRFNIDGLHFDGCSMTVSEKAATETTNDNKMLLFINVGNATEAIYSNISITNCTIDADRVMVVDGVENITISNNTFNNILYRDILLSQGGNTCGIVSGNVIISNNKSDSGKERFIRIGDASHMNLQITDNTITNYNGNDTDYIKVVGKPISSVVSGNTITDARSGRTLSITIPQ